MVDNDLNLEEFSPEIVTLLKDLQKAVYEANVDDAKRAEQTPNLHYAVHGTHLSPDEFKEIYSRKSGEKDLEDDKMYLPSFPKEHQNELNAIEKVIKEYLHKYIEQHPEYAGLPRKELEIKANIPQAKKLQKLLHIPERVFAISAKNNADGTPCLGADGLPVPDNKSYAYAIKKCCSMISSYNDNALVFGTEDRYKSFENGEQKGYMYIAKGEDFVPHFDENGVICEYTAQKDVEVVKNLEVTPKIAMEHNMQLVIFKDDETLEHWLGKNKFDWQTSDEHIESLAKEIKQGNVTYINATDRGNSPQINVLASAQQKFDENHSAIVSKNITESLDRIHKKIDDRDESTKEQQKITQKISGLQNIFLQRKKIRN